MTNESSPTFHQRFKPADRERETISQASREAGENYFFGLAGFPPFG
jgi:hypothetical protein